MTETRGKLLLGIALPCPALSFSTGDIGLKDPKIVRENKNLEKAADKSSACVCCHLCTSGSGAFYLPIDQTPPSTLVQGTPTQGPTLVLCRVVPRAWVTLQAPSSLDLLSSSVLFSHEMLSFTYLEIKCPQPKLSAEQLQDNLTRQQTGDLCALPFNQSCSFPGHALVTATGNSS